MVASMTASTVRWVRLTKHRAMERFANGDMIFLCPCKMSPLGPFSSAALISGREYLEKAKDYRDHPTLWRGSLEATAWHLIYADWEYYNASWEGGYYAHYYVQKPLPREVCP